MPVANCWMCGHFDIVCFDFWNVISAVTWQLTCVGSRRDAHLNSDIFMSIDITMTLKINLYYNLIILWRKNWQTDINFAVHLLYNITYEFACITYKYSIIIRLTKLQLTYTENVTNITYCPFCSTLICISSGFIYKRLVRLHFNKWTALYQEHLYVVSS